MTSFRHLSPYAIAAMDALRTVLFLKDVALSINNIIHGK